jgi:hypothetical protein
MTDTELYKFGMYGPWTKEEKTDTDYKTEKIGDTLYIAFQGTVSRLDFFQNLDFFAKAYKNQKFLWFAHRGFLKKFKSVEDEILKIVRESNVSKVEIFGYSQGAGLATLCHESIWYNFKNLRDTLRTVVCGSPRIIYFWNFKKIRERFHNLKRYEIKGDIITKAPPIFFLFFHVGKAKKLERRYNLFKLQKNHMDYGGRI